MAARPVRAGRGLLPTETVIYLYIIATRRDAELLLASAEQPLAEAKPVGTLGGARPYR